MNSPPPTILLIINAFLLGLRHGIDWDHIAAIFDIVGSTYPDGAIKVSRNAMLASFCYAFGHGLIVIILGAAAICFSATLPEWIDPLMERAVGLTLLLLSAWVFFSVYKHISSGGKEEFKLQSRGLLMVSALNSACNFMRGLSTGKKISASEATYNSGTAFAIGAVHGIGAETGSQILLLTAVASTSQATGIAMLFTFVLGLLTCNLAVALAGTTGFMSAARVKPLILSLGLLTGIFSLVVGSFFAFGLGDKLPDLQKYLP